MTSAQRTNARYDRIWEKAEQLKQKGTTMKAQHTQGRLRINRRSNTAIESETGRIVASTGNYISNSDNGQCHIENEANAARLALCWNTHDELVAALEKTTTAIEMMQQFVSNDVSQNGINEITTQARSALQKAKGE